MLRSTAIVLVALCHLPQPGFGQACAPGEILLKNDGLPAVPAGVTAVGLVPGVCDSQPVTVGLLQGCFPGGQVIPAHGEGIVAVFDVSAWQSVQVTKAAVMAAHATGSPGLNLVVDLEFYDGLVPVPGGFTLGTQLFDLATATGNNAQLTTHAINTIDVSPYNVVATGSTLVMLVRMEFNLNGTCASIFGTSAGFACDLIGPTPVGKNFIDGIDICTGQSSATLLDMSTIPPSVFTGNWIMRMCVVPGSTVNPLQVQFVPTNVAGPGSTAFVNFVGTPAFAGNAYLAVPSLTLAPPGAALPLPLSDPLVSLYLAGDPFVSTLFVNFSGTLPGSGVAGGIVNVPSGLPPAILPFPLHVAWVATGASGVTGISDAGTLTIQ